MINFRWAIITWLRHFCSSGWASSPRNQTCMKTRVPWWGSATARLLFSWTECKCLWASHNLYDDDSIARLWNHATIFTPASDSRKQPWNYTSPSLRRSSAGPREIYSSRSEQLPSLAIEIRHQMCWGKNKNQVPKHLYYNNLQLRGWISLINADVTIYVHDCRKGQHDRIIWVPHQHSLRSIEASLSPHFCIGKKKKHGANESSLIIHELFFVLKITKYSSSARLSFVEDPISISLSGFKFSENKLLSTESEKMEIS